MLILMSVPSVRHTAAMISGSYGGEGCPASDGFNFDGLKLTPRSDILPLPEIAMDGIPVDPEVGWGMLEFTDGLFAISDRSYVSFFAVTDDGVVIFDAPLTLRCAFNSFDKTFFFN